MTQLSLLDGHARTTDPATSHAAAGSMRDAIPHECRKVLASLRRIHSRYGRGATAWEVADDLVAQQNCVSRRLRDLADDGRVVATGRTRPGRTRRELIVWEPL